MGRHVFCGTVAGIILWGRFFLVISWLPGRFIPGTHHSCQVWDLSITVLIFYLAQLGCALRGEATPEFQLFGASSAAGWNQPLW